MVKVIKTEEYELKITRDKRGKYRWTMGVLNISNGVYDPEVCSPNQFKTESDAFEHAKFHLERPWLFSGVHEDIKITTYNDDSIGLFLKILKAIIKIFKRGK